MSRDQCVYIKMYYMCIHVTSNLLAWSKLIFSAGKLEYEGFFKKMLVWTMDFEALGFIQRVSIILYYRGIPSFLHSKTTFPSIALPLQWF